ncbi:MAG: hypothetical protein J3R72DRAFT_497983 [Linnemannia gamsii]|nr:MAG: hypothetical protein J3R72DRAFT_497983 [Linnemannia gamsii]
MILGNRMHYSEFLTEAKDELLTLDFLPLEDIARYPGHVIARPLLYDLLLSIVPAHKFLFMKQVFRIV